MAKNIGFPSLTDTDILQSASRGKDKRLFYQADKCREKKAASEASRARWGEMGPD